MRIPLRVLLPIAVAVLLACVSGVAPVTASATPAATGAELAPEVPDDPPGVPARPVPGAPRSEPRTFRQFTTYQVNVDQAGANIPGDAANEPSIAVNPLAPNSMAIGWRQFDTISSNFRQAGRGFTTDGGRTWTFPGVIDPGVFRSDPVLRSNRDGVYYYSSLLEDFDVEMFSSPDHGATWVSPVYAYGGDKQWFTIDRTDGIGSGNLYQCWNPSFGCCGPDMLTRSTDAGQTFEYPVPVPESPVWGTLDVGPDGTVYVGGVSRFDRSIFYVSRSTNAQDPTMTPTFTTATFDMGGPVQFSTGPNPGGLLGQVSIVADPTDGPSAGFVYALASVDPDGPDPLDIHFALSWDGGVHWSPWVRVNDDPPAANSWQWFGTMSVAPNGRLDAIWNDTRDTGTENLCALYYAFSTDAGVTWSANERISDFWDSHIGWPQQDKIGDYYDMVSDAVGASLAWSATFNGEQDVYFTRIGDYDCNVNGVPDSLDIVTGTSPDTNMNGIPDECEETTSVAWGGAPGAGAGFELHPNTPNPFNPRTTIQFDAAAAGARVQLRIYDSGGRRVRTLLDEVVAAGAREVAWDGRDDAGRRLASGVYYYQLEADNGFRDTRAMVLVK
jgi:hypothetical protein